MAPNQGKEQVVKRCSGVVDAISDNQGPRDNIGTGIDFESKDEFPGLVIRSLDDGVGFTFSAKGGDGRLESVKVSLCPSNLGQIADWEFNYCLSPYYKEE